MSRHGKVRPNRSKFIIVVAAGAFTIASAATATAVAWPSDPGARTAGPASIAPPRAALVAQQEMQVRLLYGYEIDVAAAKNVAAGQQAQAVQRKARQQLAAQAAEQARKRAEAAQAAAAAKQASAAAKQSAAASASQPPSGSAGTGSTPGTGSSAAPSGSPQQIAHAMLAQFGWSSSQFSCLDPLWQQESGWQVTAYNAGSGAYGIPQALPGSKMASAGPDWQTNAATQIRWGLQYIQGLYGSPCAAWSHEQATGWY